MKKFHFVLAMLLVVLFTIPVSSASAQEWEVNSCGEVRLKTTDVWKTSVALNEACNNPGQEVVNDWVSEKIQRVSFWYHAPTATYMVCQDGQLITGIEKEGALKFSWHVLLMLLGVAVVVIWHLCAIVMWVTWNVKWGLVFNNANTIRVNVGIGVYSFIIGLFYLAPLGNGSSDVATIATLMAIASAFVLHDKSASTRIFGKILYFLLVVAYCALAITATLIGWFF